MPSLVNRYGEQNTLFNYADGQQSSELLANNIERTYTLDGADRMLTVKNTLNPSTDLTWYYCVYDPRRLRAPRGCRQGA